MTIWIDADACPNVIKDIIFRASERTKIKVILVANKPMRVPLNGLVSTIQVPQGFDMADERILKDLSPLDVVITGDIPFADAAITKGAIAIDPRGELFTEENIKDRLATRHLMEGLRDAGMVSGGPRPLALKDRQAFANKLDAILARQNKKAS